MSLNGHSAIDIQLQMNHINNFIITSPTRCYGCPLAGTLGAREQESFYNVQSYCGQGGADGHLELR